MQTLRRFGIFLYGCYAWIVFVTLLLAFIVLALPAPRNGARRLARRFARAMLWLGRIPVSAHGLEHLPAQQHVLVSNHTSFLDAIVLIALLPAPPGYTFTTRRQRALQLFLWPFVRSMRALVLRRHAPAHHGVNVEIMKAALKRGENLLVFPEGAFAPEPGLLPFHSGAFVAAAQTRTPLAVAGLHGAREALRMGTWIPRRAPITLRIGPVFTPLRSDPAAVRELMEAARAAMIPISGEADRTRGGR